MEADGDIFWRYEGRHRMACERSKLYWSLSLSSFLLCLSLFYFFSHLSLSLSLSPRVFQAGVKKWNSTIFQLTNFNGKGVGVCLGNKGEIKRRVNWKAIIRRIVRIRSWKKLRNKINCSAEKIERKIYFFLNSVEQKFIIIFIFNLLLLRLLVNYHLIFISFSFLSW